MKIRFHIDLPLGGVIAVTSALAPILAAPAPLTAAQHWDHMPVRIYFPASRTATQERVNAAALGFGEWSAASGGVLWYSVVDSPADADIVVQFIPAKSVAGDANRVGETETASRGGVLKRADIRLATADTNMAQLQEEAAHEWGHALGIAGHSSDPQDLMYPSTTRVFDLGTGEYRPTPMRTVSAADLRAVRSAYAKLFRAAEDGPGQTSSR